MSTFIQNTSIINTSILCTALTFLLFDIDEFNCRYIFLSSVKFLLVQLSTDVSPLVTDQNPSGHPLQGDPSGD